MDFVTMVISLLNFVLLIRIYAMIEPFNKEKKPVKKKKETYNNENYLHTLEFNTKLDGIIVPLLGRYSNEDIIKQSILKLKNDENLSGISENILAKYINDTLLNYRNPYINTDNNIDDVQIDEEVDYKTWFPESNSNMRNIDSALNNFYK